MNQRGADSILTSQVKLRGDIAAATELKAAALQPLRMPQCGQRFCRIRVQEDCSPGFLLKAQLGPDNDGNERLYGKGTTAKDIVINGAIRPRVSENELLVAINIAGFSSQRSVHCNQNPH
jgi:hypothetical protein